MSCVTLLCKYTVNREMKITHVLLHLRYSACYTVNRYLKNKNTCGFHLFSTWLTLQPSIYTYTFLYLFMYVEFHHVVVWALSSAPIVATVCNALFYLNLNCLEPKSDSAHCWNIGNQSPRLTMSRLTGFICWKSFTWRAMFRTPPLIILSTDSRLLTWLKLLALFNICI